MPMRVPRAVAVGLSCIGPANLFRKLSSQEFHDLFVCEGGSSHHDYQESGRPGHSRLVNSERREL